MTEYTIVEVIKKKFAETGSPVNIPLQIKDSTFEASLAEDGINVDNLANSPHLPWKVFVETVNLIKTKGGRAYKGNAMQHKLGSNGLPLDSVEGYIAYEVYGKKLNQSVFRRITPISGILVWSNICTNEPNELVLNPEFID